ncbi:MAG: ATPase, T2SS/T4P/T4SS family [Proteobacteria bacterium]|nr:ATPase, T2SS/T4P/T4SS family [Pseudomonadota bacterium]
MSREPNDFLINNPKEKAPVEALNDLFRSAVRQGVSDVHLHDVGGKLTVRIRHPGSNLVVVPFGESYGQIVNEKIRSRAQIPVADQVTIQDGRLRLTFPDIPAVIDVRVSVAPTVNGQKIVCRILDQAHSNWTLGDLGVDPMIRESLKEITLQPHGLFIVTGPTGSGKTTTLYALVNHLDDDSRNIVTVENPVEYILARLTQIDVNQVHISFAGALRGVLRQDPDVILVGEIRDSETAKIAVDASATGHLVLATMHANSAAEAPRRLIDLGADPVTLASALLGVTAQRLVRAIGDAAEPELTTPNDVERRWLTAYDVPLAGGEFPTVSSTDAYTGNVPLVEFIRCDQKVRAAIAAGGTANAVLDACSNQSQYENLAYAGARLAASGKTTLAEVRRVVGDESGQKGGRRLGYYLLASGVVDSHTLSESLSRQWDCYHAGRVVRLGTVLAEMGACSQEAVDEALAAMHGELARGGRQVVELVA